jgi:hypothetical protein
MSIFDNFSKRQKRLRGDVSDVYTYDTVPNPLRVQIVYILRDTLGDEGAYSSSYLEVERAYKFIVETLCREYGVFSLRPPKSYVRDYLVELAEFLLNEQDHEKTFDAIELSFRVIDKVTRSHGYLLRHNASELADNAIQELNARLQEHGVGYQFIDGEIIRVDSELLHAEVVKPALALLRAHEYAGAQAEFLTAHEHYRHGRNKEALAESLKSLESVMKAICAKRRWTHDPNATSNALIKVIFDSGLIPPFLAQHFSGLRATLESGVPTTRNRLAGHGQGVQVVEVPAYLVSYVLHQTASTIVLLAEAEKALP